MDRQTDRQRDGQTGEPSTSRFDGCFAHASCIGRQRPQSQHRQQHRHRHQRQHQHQHLSRLRLVSAALSEFERQADNNTRDAAAVTFTADDADSDGLFELRVPSNTLSCSRKISFSLSLSFKFNFNMLKVMLLPMLMIVLGTLAG